MRSISTLLGSAVLGLLLVGCSVSAPLPPPTSPPAASPSGTTPSPTATVAAETFAPGAPANQCHTADLAATIQGPDGSAGHLNYRIVFTNSGADCVLEGYPEVTVLKSAGSAILGAPAANDANTTGAAVDLATGATAVAILTAVNIDPGGGPLGSQCILDHGDGFVITPPHSLQPLKVMLAGVPACSNGTAWMTVGPVTSG